MSAMPGTSTMGSGALTLIHAAVGSMGAMASFRRALRGASTSTGRMPGSLVISSMSHCGVAGSALFGRTMAGFMGGVLVVPGVRARSGLRQRGLPARRRGAVPVGVAGALERLALLLSLSERRRALAGNARLSPAAHQGGEHNQPDGGSRGYHLVGSKHRQALPSASLSAGLDEIHGWARVPEKETLPGARPRGSRAQVMWSGRGSDQGNVVDGGREQRQGTVHCGGDHSCLGLDGEDRDLESNERHHVAGMFATAILV
jgi:hypothetical protein